MVYAIQMYLTCVYTRFYQSQLVYTSVNIHWWFATIPNLSYTQIIIFTKHYMCQYTDLEQAWSNRIEMIHSKPLDPDISLYLILHQLLRFLLGSDIARHHEPITCILYLILHQIFSTFCVPLPNDLLPLLYSLPWYTFYCPYSPWVPSEIFD